jgi:holo-[acyl-carrier protein] synthase
MIYSLGIDLTDTERIGRALEKWGPPFAQKILGEEEYILYCQKTNKVQFLAGRFAAKEAVIKTLGAFFERHINFRDVQILNDLYGKPYVHLEDNLRERIIDKEIKVSITHERKMAAAMAMITGD